MITFTYLLDQKPHDRHWWKIQIQTQTTVRSICFEKHITNSGAERVNESTNYLKLSVIGVSVGAVAGTGYSLYKLNKTTTHILNEEIFISPIDNIPESIPSRQILYDADQSNLKLTLYQYQTCPFCCKVRAFLDYYGISYDIIEVDPVLRQSIKWSTYKKVPILVANVGDSYQPLNDSSMIISALTSYMQDPKTSLTDIVKCYPLISFVDNGSKKCDIMNKYFIMQHEEQSLRSKAELDEERKWRKWADDVLVHTLSPNVYRTRTEAYQAFNWFSQTGDWEKLFPNWERYMMIYVGANAMWLIGKRLKTKYNLKEDVRLSLYEECDKWAKAVKNTGRPFLGGMKPNLADLSVYGILSSIEGCDAFKDLLSHSNIGGWYVEMKNVVNSRKNMQIT
ncbi:Glutaredoxin [Popillia japonica]|uniref:Glutaredoxin n=1 Tax=Popillia japonica TaxID=7064 RepID=A0AAW1K121_POPJA